MYIVLDLHISYTMSKKNVYVYIYICICQKTFCITSRRPNHDPKPYPHFHLSSHITVRRARSSQCTSQRCCNGAVTLWEVHQEDTARCGVMKCLQIFGHLPKPSLPMLAIGADGRLIHCDCFGMSGNFDGL